MSHIRPDRFRWRVAWEMTPAEARDLAEFIRGAVRSEDLAHHDADELERAANDLEPASPEVTEGEPE